MGIDSITLSTQKGSLYAANYSKLAPLMKTEQKGSLFITTVTKEQFTDADKELWDSNYKSGKTVTFPPINFSVFWNYTPDGNEKLSDTIDITVKYSSGATQKSVLSIGENDNGIITAVLS
jgi:hypothetical protein